LNSVKIDWMGLTCTVVFIISAVAPPIATVAAMLLNLDPWESILEYILPPEMIDLWVTKIIYNGLATLYIFSVVAEGARHIPMIFLLLVIPTLTLVEAIQLMVDNQKKSPGSAGLIQAYKMHMVLRINNLNGMRFLPQEVFLLTTFGTVLVCFLNLITLRCYDLMPPELYSISVIGNVIGLVVMNVTASSGTKIHEDSKEALMSWKIDFGNGSKYLRKKYRGMHCIGYYAGLNDFNFFLYQRSFKSELFQSMVNNTVNLLLSLPPSDLRKLII